ncbi:LytR/AlgR family response regulator transcription factor [Aureibacter tunicatorum]|uniref:DNA-binding LytR/AlgR family response regulator n=1 Tax=Aureibacter tunicatorum TaxID=866807 RepID=A0AAE3XL11_9BACT|nr:LytTR family DNA-binding domain-containing protein [Aureibacter tunicatorum]MDR6237870.1 DNA-binding LytR/AlgR family response regulator [Aureibacter tunicatorum]BDD02905.1 DNA-binding response regulator [Aureibacter tunicatorum]
MRILIIEDEYLTADWLEELIKSYDPEFEVVAKLMSVEESVKWLKENKHPNLIFQDIELTDGKCFEIYQQVKVNAPIVFTTAYSQYALEAFKLNSIDYIVKPYDKAEVKKVLDKFSNMKNMFSDNSQDDFQELLQLKDKPEKKRFLIKIGDKYKSIKSEEVAIIYYDEGISFIRLFNGDKYPIDNSLSDLEQQLNKEIFFRVNRKYIVNINSIGNISSWFNSRIIIETEPKTDEEMIVSRERVKSFKNWLDGGV